MNKAIITFILTLGILLSNISDVSAGNIYNPNEDIKINNIVESHFHKVKKTYKYGGYNRTYIIENYLDSKLKAKLDKLPRKKLLNIYVKIQSNYHKIGDKIYNKYGVKKHHEFLGKIGAIREYIYYVLVLKDNYSEKEEYTKIVNEYYKK